MHSRWLADSLAHAREPACARAGNNPPACVVGRQEALKFGVLKVRGVEVRGVEVGGVQVIGQQEQALT